MIIIDTNRNELYTYAARLQQGLLFTFSKTMLHFFRFDM